MFLSLCTAIQTEAMPHCAVLKGRSGRPLSLSYSLPIQVACSASLAIVDGFNEFHGGSELHPPIALLPAQPAGVEIIDVLNGGQKAGWVRLRGERGGGGGLTYQITPDHPRRACLHIRMRLGAEKSGVGVHVRTQENTNRYGEQNK